MDYFTVCQCVGCVAPVESGRASVELSMMLNNVKSQRELLSFQFFFNLRRCLKGNLWKGKRKASPRKDNIQQVWAGDGGK